MEQIRLFLTEYSDWVAIAWGCLVVVLPAVTLHRIKKAEKRILKATDRAWQQVADRLPEGSGKVPEGNGKVAEARQEEGTMEDAASKGAAFRQEDMPETPETLLNAVLGEVFP